MKQLLLIAMGIGVLSWCAMAQSAEALFGEGQHQEEVEGNLEQAIQTYSQVVEKAGADRTLAARAQFRIGASYEKLGRQEAANAYQSVIRDFADQQDLVRQAQARLAALQPTEESMSVRLVWKSGWIDGTVSDNGRLVSFTDWSVQGRGNVAVRDLITGTNRLLSSKQEGDHSFADGSSISPDGLQVAYTWTELGESDGKAEFQIRVVPTSGDGSPRIVFRNPDGEYVYTGPWTPDGQQVLIVRNLADRRAQLAMLSLEDGSARELKTFESRGVGASLSPDGRFVAYDVSVGDGQERDIFLMAAGGGQEVAVVQHPADDQQATWTPDGSRILFVSDRTATPSLWTVTVRDGSPIGEAELVKSDIGGIQVKGITRTGTLYYRLSSRLRRSVYRVAVDDEGKASGSPSVFADRFVKSNWGAALSPDGESLAYYSNRPQQMLVIRNVESGQERGFPVDMGEIRTIFFEGPQWFPDGRSVLVWVQRPQRPGYIFYRIDTSTGKAEELMTADGQLFKFSPDGTSVFCRRRDGASSVLARFDLSTGEETVVRGAPQGAVFSDLAVSPDGKELVYNLQVGENDEGTYFYVVPSTGGEPRLVFRDVLWGYHARYNSLRWTPDQTHVLFVKDGDSGNSSLWSVPVDGSAAEPVGVEIEGIIKAPQLHPDDRSIFFTKIEDGDELWALENFLPSQPANQ